MVIAILQHFEVGALVFVVGIFAVLFSLVVKQKRHPDRSWGKHLAIFSLLSTAAFLILFSLFSANISSSSILQVPKITIDPHIIAQLQEKLDQVFAAPKKKVIALAPDKAGKKGKVLAATTNIFDNLTFKFNVPSIFKAPAEFDSSIGATSASFSGQVLANGGLTVSGPIVLNPTSATQSNGDMNLSSGSRYLINNVPIVTNTTLGAPITISSLVRVGALTGGSIGTGFGVINTGNSITGSTINGSTITSTGNVIGVIV